MPLPRLICLLAFLLPRLVWGVDSVVTFDEVHYHPVSLDECEWIELRNQMSIRVDLSGWKIGGGVAHTFPDGTIIEPKGHVVVDAALFEGRLDNAGEALELRDRNGRLMDLLEYGDDVPWPVGADGSGWSLSKRGPSLASREASSWVASLPTPGKVNVSAAPLGNLRLSEIGAGLVELWNDGENAILMDGFELRDDVGGVVALRGSIPPGGYQLVEAEMTVLFLWDDEGRLLDAARVKDREQGRLPDDETWYFTDEPTPGVPNAITLSKDIVIHEIMYHFPPVYDQPGTVENEFAERDEEWIELYNRGETAVDLSGWSLGGGIAFAFPEGTSLESEAFLVVANDGETLRKKYPSITVIWDFSGKLSNRSDVILLRDQNGNAADYVRYVDSGRWPTEADGRGSSLELRDPWADNAQPEAWQASDETNKSEWVTISYERRGAEPPSSNNPSNFHEFLMGLLDAGEVLVDDVSVIADPHGTATELMKNGGFELRNIFSGELNDWRGLGTHAATYVVDSGDGSQLRVVADGAIEHTYNTVSSILRAGQQLEATQTYGITFRARWLAGSPQLNTRLYLNRMGRTHVLPIPNQLGSPGTGRGANIGPTFEGLAINPLIPRVNEPITIAVEARDPQGVVRLKLFYRSPNTDWHSVEMRDGSGTIPGQASGTVIQFYIHGTDGEGVEAFFPAKAVDSRALLRVGEANIVNTSVDTLRLILWPAEHDFMRRPEHVVSNGRVGGTLITDGDYHFDVGVRLRSSPYGRRGNRVGYNVVLGNERPYRGVHSSIAIDRGSVMPNGNSNGFFEVKTGAGVNELIVNQIAQRAGGIPSTYDDVVFIETPNPAESSLAQLRMARYGAAYLDGQYENGAQGATHKFELIYHPTTTIGNRVDALKGPYTAVLGIDIQDMGDDKEAYRFNYLPTNNRDRDDFTGIIRLGDAFSARTDSLRREMIPQAIDVEQWMRVFAFQSLIGVADTYNMGLEHNLVLYTRPSDQRVLAFPWDLDHAFFYTPTADLLGRGGTNLASFIALPENRRLFYGHLEDLLDTAFNTESMESWVEHLNEVTGSDYSQRILNYIDRRADHVRSELQTQVRRTFQITTNQGRALETDQPSILLEGNGWVDVRNIRNESSGAFLDLIWTSVNEWQAEIPLTLGDNELRLQAVDFQGQDLGSIFSPGEDTITVNHTGTVEAASAENLRISELHYHPSNEEAEFIELQNMGSGPIDLRGVQFTRGIQWQHDTSTILQPGEVALLVRVLDAFNAALPILGSYGPSQLSNGGETIRIEGLGGSVIQEFRYDDRLPWPEEADGHGYSLEARSRGGSDSSYAWRLSVDEGGSPGIANAFEPLGDADLLDYAFGDRVPLETYSNGQLTLTLNTLADEVRWTLQASADLQAWEDVVMDLRSRVQVGDRSVFTWTTNPHLPYHRLVLHSNLLTTT